VDVLVSLVDALQDLTGIDFRSKTKNHVVWKDAEEALNGQKAGRPGTWEVHLEGTEDSESLPPRFQRLLVESAGSDASADGASVEWGSDGCTLRFNRKVGTVGCKLGGKAFWMLDDTGAAEIFMDPATLFSIDVLGQRNSSAAAKHRHVKTQDASYHQHLMEHSYLPALEKVAGVVEEHLFTPDEPVSRNRTRRPVLGWRYSGAAGEPEQPRASARQRVQGSYEDNEEYEWALEIVAARCEKDAQALIQKWQKTPSSLSETNIHDAFVAQNIPEGEAGHDLQQAVQKVMSGSVHSAERQRQLDASVWVWLNAAIHERQPLGRKPSNLLSKRISLSMIESGCTKVALAIPSRARVGVPGATASAELDKLSRGADEQLQQRFKPGVNLDAEADNHELEGYANVITGDPHGELVLVPVANAVVRQSWKDKYVKGAHKCGCKGLCDTLMCACVKMAMRCLEVGCKCDCRPERRDDQGAIVQVGRMNGAEQVLRKAEKLEENLDFSEKCPQYLWKNTQNIVQTSGYHLCQVVNKTSGPSVDLDGKMHTGRQHKQRALIGSLVREDSGVKTSRKDLIPALNATLMENQQMSAILARGYDSRLNQQSSREDQDRAVNKRKQKEMSIQRKLLRLLCEAGLRPGGIDGEHEPAFDEISWSLWKSLAKSLEVETTNRSIGASLQNLKARILETVKDADNPVVKERWDMALAVCADQWPLKPAKGKLLRKLQWLPAPTNITEFKEQLDQVRRHLLRLVLYPTEELRSGLTLQSPLATTLRDLILASPAAATVLAERGGATVTQAVEAKAVASEMIVADGFGIGEEDVDAVCEFGQSMSMLADMATENYRSECRLKKGEHPALAIQFVENYQGVSDALVELAQEYNNVGAILTEIGMDGESLSAYNALGALQTFVSKRLADWVPLADKQEKKEDRIARLNQAPVTTRTNQLLPSTRGSAGNYRVIEGVVGDLVNLLKHGSLSGEVRAGYESVQTKDLIGCHPFRPAPAPGESSQYGTPNRHTTSFAVKFGDVYRDGGLVDNKYKRIPANGDTAAWDEMFRYEIDFHLRKMLGLRPSEKTAGNIGEARVKLQQEAMKARSEDKFSELMALPHDRPVQPLAADGVPRLLQHWTREQQPLDDELDQDANNSPKVEDPGVFLMFGCDQAIAQFVEDAQSRGKFPMVILKLGVLHYLFKLFEALRRTYASVLKIMRILVGSTNTTDSMEYFVLDASTDLVKTADALRKLMHGFMLAMHALYCKSVNKAVSSVLLDYRSEDSPFRAHMLESIAQQGSQSRKYVILEFIFNTQLVLGLYDGIRAGSWRRILLGIYGCGPLLMLTPGMAKYKDTHISTIARFALMPEATMHHMLHRGLSRPFSGNGEFRAEEPIEGSSKSKHNVGNDEGIETHNDIMTMQGIKTLDQYVNRSKVLDALHANRVNTEFSLRINRRESHGPPRNTRMQLERTVHSIAQFLLDNEHEFLEEIIPAGSVALRSYEAGEELVGDGLLERNDVYRADISHTRDLVMTLDEMKVNDALRTEEEEEAHEENERRKREEEEAEREHQQRLVDLQVAGEATANREAVESLQARLSTATDKCSKVDCDSAHYLWERCGLADCHHEDKSKCGPPCHGALDPACCHRWWGSGCALASAAIRQSRVLVCRMDGSIIEQRVFVCAECSQGIDRVRVAMEANQQPTAIRPAPGFWASQ